MAQQSSPASTFESTGGRHQTGELRLSRDVLTFHIADEEYGIGIEHIRDGIAKVLAQSGHFLDIPTGDARQLALGLVRSDPQKTRHHARVFVARITQSVQ